ncbi:MAG: tRNA (guanosine(18)-2'-O)-methyltransferase TrmH [Porticoccaceae bacterium]|nr:tRNA (guanosine(18)-2'-O)-methyltransferase TrmH [Porticoccaceae bacterium]
MLDLFAFSTSSGREAERICFDFVAGTLCCSASGLQFSLTKSALGRQSNMTPERYHKIRKTLERRQPDLTLLADQVRKGRNLAAMRRTCDAFAVGEMHAVIPEEEGIKRYAGISAGTNKRVQTIHHKKVDEAVAELQGRGMRIAVADMTEQAVSYQDFDFTQPTAILMGSEELGVSPEAKALADDFIYIPMMGLVESLNVSVAFALILSEACRQRESAGMFDQPRLPMDEIDRLAFEWGYPKLKNYYLGKKMAYPELDEEGQIIDS